MVSRVQKKTKFMYSQMPLRTVLLQEIIQIAIFYMDNVEEFVSKCHLAVSTQYMF